MEITEETIDATLDGNGQLALSHPSQLPPGPVRVTIRASTAAAPARRLADVIREIAADQHARGFSGRPAQELLRAEDVRPDCRYACAGQRDPR